MRPGTIGTLTLPHRIVMGAMHLGIESGGDAGRLAAFYVERVRGGAALIVTGGMAVSRVGAGGRNYGRINEDDHAALFRHLAVAVHAAGGRIALQLFHAGRYAFPQAFALQPVAPSAVASAFSRALPRALNEDEIVATIADFARGAARARAFGYDAVEVMASEGYLVNQFLSPVTNRRDDGWGGDLEGRMRFGIELLRAIRREVGRDFPVIFRISGADLVDGSTTEDETRAFARRLADEGVDALNVGVGWHESRIPTVQACVAPGAWIPYAAAIKAVVGELPVVASNRVNTLELANRILAESAVDFISMARPFLADPAIVAKSFGGGGGSANRCIACNQACIDRSLVDEPISCMVNPSALREGELAAKRSSKAARRFAVVGGGPAGLEAARVLATLGHRVVLFEAAPELGGQFRLARRIPGKEEFAATIRYFSAELARLGVRVELGRAIGAAQVAMLREFDGIVVASGVVPRTLGIPGSDLPHVRSYAGYLADVTRGRQSVAIVGAGGIGVDVARLACEGAGAASVSVLCRGDRIAPRIGRSTRWVVLDELRERGVALLTNVRPERITADGVVIADASGEARLIEAQLVVVAAGQVPNAALTMVLRERGIAHAVVGGARATEQLDAVRAFGEGLRVGYELGAAA